MQKKPKVSCSPVGLTLKMFSPAMHLQFFDFLLPERSETNAHSFSQRHPSNWVDADEDEDDGGGDDADGNELCVQSTPPYCEEQ